VHFVQYQPDYDCRLVDCRPGCRLSQQLKRLQVLCLRKGCEFTPKGLCAMFASDDLSGLRHVDFSECQQLNDDVIVAMCRWLVLEVNECHVTAVTSD